MSGIDPIYCPYCERNTEGVKIDSLTNCCVVARASCTLLRIGFEPLREDGSLITALSASIPSRKAAADCAFHNQKSRDRSKLIERMFYPWWIVRVNRARNPWFPRLNLLRYLLQNDDDRDAFLSLLRMSKTREEDEHAIDTAIEWVPAQTSPGLARHLKRHRRLAK